MPSSYLISESKFGISEFEYLVKKFSCKCGFKKICCLDNAKIFHPSGLPSSEALTTP